jgi:hypothetical protein
LFSSHHKNSPKSTFTGIGAALNLPNWLYVAVQHGENYRQKISPDMLFCCSAAKNQQSWLFTRSGGTCRLYIDTGAQVAQSRVLLPMPAYAVPHFMHFLENLV